MRGCTFQLAEALSQKCNIVSFGTSLTEIRRSIYLFPLLVFWFGVIYRSWQKSAEWGKIPHYLISFDICLNYCYLPQTLPYPQHQLLRVATS